MKIPRRSSGAAPAQGRPQRPDARAMKRRRRRLARQRAARQFATALPEPLEGRQLLTATMWSTADVQQMFTPQRLDAITGVTVITHGFQASDSDGDSLLELAQAIDLQADLNTRGGGWLLDYDLRLGSDGKSFVEGFDPDQSRVNLAQRPSEVVLLWDWAPESKQTTTGWTEASGDALFSTLVGLGLVDPSKGAAQGREYHFIGHSFGCAATSEAVERMGAYGVTVDQVTYLDPHDFRQDGDSDGVVFTTDKGLLSSIYTPSLDGGPLQWTLGAPHGPTTAVDGRSSYGATVWNNVRFADVYYQTTHEPLIQNQIPEGRPIPGAYNRLVGENEPGLLGNVNDHSAVWNKFYEGTVDYNSRRSIDPKAPFPEGYAFSRLANSFAGSSPEDVAKATAAARAPAKPNFYSSSQDHTWSSPQLVKYDPRTGKSARDPVTGNWIPNTSGLANFGITRDMVTSEAWPGWTPEWSPNTIVNGSFQSSGLGSTRESFVPGWTNHGGGGSATVATNALKLSFTAPSRTHNRLYVPPTAGLLAFTTQRTAASTHDQLSVWIDNDAKPIKVIALDQRDTAPVLQTVSLPQVVRNGMHTITFSIDRNNSSSTRDEAVVLVDDVRFASQIGSTGDLIPIDLSAILDAAAAGPYSIQTASLIVPGSGPLSLNVRPNPRRGNIELTYTDPSTGKDLLAGYLILSDRVATAGGAFSTTGKAWFAPATGVFERDTATAADGVASLFKTSSVSWLPGDIGSQQGFQGIVSLGVTAGAARRSVGIEVTAGSSGNGDAAVTGGGSILEAARLQQRLNYLNGQKIGTKTVASADAQGRPLVIDGISGAATLEALQNFKASFVAAGATVASDLDPATIARLNTSPSVSAAERKRLAAALKNARGRFSLAEGSMFQKALPFTALPNAKDSTQADIGRRVDLRGLLGSDLGLFDAVLDPLATRLTSDAGSGGVAAHAMSFAALPPAFTFVERAGDPTQPGRLVYDVTFDYTTDIDAFLDIGDRLREAGFSFGGSMRADLTAHIKGELRLGIDLSSTSGDSGLFFLFDDVDGVAGGGVTISLTPTVTALDAIDFNAGFLSLSATPTVSLTASLNLRLPETKLDDMVPELIANSVIVTGSASAGLSLAASAKLFGATVYSGTITVADGNILDADKPSLTVPKSGGLGQLLNLDGWSIREAFNSLGAFFSSIKATDVLQKSVPLLKGVTVGDRVNFDAIWRSNVLTVFDKTPATAAPATIQQLLDRLSPLLGADRGSYDAATGQLRLSFDLSTPLAAIDEPISLGARFGELASIETSSRISVRAIGDLRFTLGIDVSSAVGAGFDLTRQTQLSALNAGRGVRTNAAGLSDFAISRSDGSVFGVDVPTSGTVGDLLDVINALAPGRLVASILRQDVADPATGAFVAKGVALVIAETASPGTRRTLSIDPLDGSNAAADLGIVATVKEVFETGEYAGRLTVIGSPLHGQSILDRVYLATSDTDPSKRPSLSGRLTLTADSIEAKAKLGLASVAVTGGTATAQASVVLSLVDPATRARDNRITVRELLDVASLSRIGTMISASADPVTASAMLPISADLLGAKIDAPSGVTITWNDWALPPSIGYDSRLGDLRQFTSLTGDKIADALGNVADMFQRLASGDAETAAKVLSTPLPFVGRSIADMLGISAALRRLSDAYKSAPAVAVNELDAALKKAFGGVGQTQPWVSLQGPVLRFTIPITLGVLGAKASLNIGGELLKSPAGALIDAKGSGQINFAFDTGVTLDMGIDLTQPASPRPFLFTGTTRATIAAGLQANNLQFSAAVGPIGAVIRDGTLAIDADGDARTAAPASITAALGGGTNGRLYLDNLATATFETTTLAKVGLVLPVFRADDTSKPLDDAAPRLAWSFDLTRLGSSSLPTPQMLPNFANILNSITDLTKSLSGLGDGWDGLFNALELVVDRTALVAKLPLVGDQLQTALRFLLDMRRKGADNLNSIPASQRTSGAVKQALFEAFKPANLGWLLDRNEDQQITIDDIEVATVGNDIVYRMRLGRDLATLDVPVGIDFSALGALGLKLDGAVSVKAGFQFELGFGISKEKGVFLETDRKLPGTNHELEFTIEAGLPNTKLTKLTGTFGPLRVEVADKGTKLAGTFAIDLLDVGGIAADNRLTTSELSSAGIGAVVDTSFSTTASDIRLGINVGVGSALPSLETDLVVGWPFTGSLAGGVPSVYFENLRMDMGAAVNQILTPVFGLVNNTLKPVREILDALNSEVPIISELSGKNVTFADLAKMLGTSDIAEATKLLGAIVKAADLGQGINSSIKVDLIKAGQRLQLAGGAGDARSLSFEQFFDGLSLDSLVDSLLNADPRLAEIGKIVKMLTDAGSPFGSSAAAAISPNAKAAISPAAAVQTGFSFPIFDPKQAISILFGKKVDLVTFFTPRIELFSFDYGPTTLVTPVPVVRVSLGGKLSGTFQFGFSYDTGGLMKFAETRKPMDLLAGFAFRNDAGPLIGLGGSIDVSLMAPFLPSIPLPVPGVSLSIDLGAEGSIVTDVGLKFRDPNNDGRVYYEEFAANFSKSPLAVFDVTGGVTAKLGVSATIVGVLGLLIRIPIVTFKQDVVNVKLVDFDNVPPVQPSAQVFEEEPATQSGQTLTLNTGGADDIFDVIREGDGVRVTRKNRTDTDPNRDQKRANYSTQYGGLSKVYRGVTQIVGDGGAGDDVIRIAADVPVPVRLFGGEGNDELWGGSADDLLVGGLGNDILVGATTGSKVGSTTTSSGAAWGATRSMPATAATSSTVTVPSRPSSRSSIATACEG